MPDHRLLVIEDDPDMGNLVRRIASSAGFDVRVVTAGSEVIPVYDEFDPRVIVLDICMPEMDGFEVLRFLHLCKSEAHVVILSGDNDYRPLAAHLADGLSIDVAANLEKPFRAHELIAALESIKRALASPEAKISA